MTDDWITTAEGGVLTGYSQKHVRRLIKDGLVSGRRIDPIWLVDRQSLLKYFRKMEAAGEKRGPKPKT